jgi:hypothetical protein
VGGTTVGGISVGTASRGGFVAGMAVGAVTVGGASVTGKGVGSGLLHAVKTKMKVSIVSGKNVIFLIKFHFSSKVSNPK